MQQKLCLCNLATTLPKMPSIPNTDSSGDFTAVHPLSATATAAVTAESGKVPPRLPFLNLTPINNKFTLAFSL